MLINDARADGAAVVAPVGRIDTTTAPALERHFSALLDARERRIVVDFSAVDYISSAGLRVMLSLARRMRDGGGGLALCGVAGAVRQVFELAGFLPLFTVCDTRDAAAARLGSSAAP